MSRLAQIESMLAKEPQDAFLNFAKAMELVKLERHDEAVAQFCKVTDLDPNYIPAYFQRGRTLLGMGRTEDAVQALRHGIAVANQTGDGHAAAEMTELLEAIS